MIYIRRDNLPLPLFIRGDDVEFGLRNMKKLILLNGICVWHEPFENKYSSFLNYYIIRNRLIDNVIHCKNWSKKDIKKYIWTNFSYEAKLLRYKNIELMHKGIEDFMKGSKFLTDTDPSLLHQEIMNLGYKAIHVSEITYPITIDKYLREKTIQTHGVGDLLRKITFNGMFLGSPRSRILNMSSPSIPAACRASRIVFYDSLNDSAFECSLDCKKMIKLCLKTKKLIKSLCKEYDNLTKDYNDAFVYLTSIKFWNSYLQI